MGGVHDFEKSLAMSHAASDWGGWEDVYRTAFQSFSAMVDHRQDGPHQRAGIDRSVILANSKQFLIDEKVRGRNKVTGRVYEDIALEFLSDVERKTPGWVCKPLLADYIAYAILPLGICYLLPVIQLQQAWMMHSAEWCASYPVITAKNTTWNTDSCCVPAKVLYGAIGSTLRVRFDPVEMDT